MTDARNIMIVKKTDFTGTSTKHITITGEFSDEVYMEVTSEDIIKRRNTRGIV